MLFNAGFDIIDLEDLRVNGGVGAQYFLEVRNLLLGDLFGHFEVGCCVDVV